MLTIGGLNQGIVLDHIKVGGAMKIYTYLNLDGWIIAWPLLKMLEAIRWVKRIL
jgi:aspartate carbamoyltransferase regulatory subunit